MGFEFDCNKIIIMAQQTFHSPTIMTFGTIPVGTTLVNYITPISVANTLYELYFPVNAHMNLQNFAGELGDNFKLVVNGSGYTELSIILSNSGVYLLESSFTFYCDTSNFANYDLALYNTSLPDEPILPQSRSKFTLLDDPVYRQTYKTFLIANRNVPPKGGDPYNQGLMSNTNIYKWKIQCINGTNAINIKDVHFVLTHLG